MVANIAPMEAPQRSRKNVRLGALTDRTLAVCHKPAITAPAQDLNLADIPFATWAPGKLGIVKSPYDPDGRLFDVRDFNAGQMSQ